MESILAKLQKIKENKNNEFDKFSLEDELLKTSDKKADDRKFYERIINDLISGKATIEDLKQAIKRKK